MKKASITKVRAAGRNEHGAHQVVSLKGGKFCHRKEPCPTCPWRVDAVGQFPAEAFRHSAHTAYDTAQETFACHSSGTKNPATCAGFLLRGANHNIGIRLKAITGEFRYDQVSDGGHELHENYRAMAVANGVAPDDPVLQPCRD